MARWKLSRIAFGNEEYTFLEDDEVTLGRGINNTISLSSIVVSRNHCVINVKADKVLITDLKSSNGIYVGLKKIPPNVPFSLDDSDIIGIGWTKGAPVANIKDHEKYMFKLTKEKPPPITSRLTFQSDDEIEPDVVVTKLSNNSAISPVLTTKQTTRTTSSDQNRLTASSNSPENKSKPAVKRKLMDNTHYQKVQVKRDSNKNKLDDDVITILSDSENEAPPKQETVPKKPKIEPIDPPTDINEVEIKTEREECDFDAFKVKQEYLDDEPIQIDSESDDESVQWLIRLSQSSPGKSLTKVARESEVAREEHEESSYSQIDDFEDMDDPISILPQQPEDNKQKHSPDSGIGEKTSEQKMDVEDEEEDFLDDLISLNIPDEPPPKKNDVQVDVVDGSSKNQLNIPETSSYTTSDVNNQIKKTQEVQSVDKDDEDSDKEYLLKILEGDITPAPESSNKNKTTQIIEALAKPSHSRSTSLLINSKYKSSSATSKHSKDKHKKRSSSRRHITDSQKEERKKKLKDIANKEKEESKRRSSSNSSTKDKTVINAKVTSTNRGAFLTDVVQGVVKPMKRKDSPPKPAKINEKVDKTSSDLPVVKESGDNVEKKSNAEKPSKDTDHDIENKKKRPEKHNSSKQKEKEKSSKEHRSSKTKEKDESAKAKPINSKSRPPSTEVRIPLKSLKPLSESEDSFSGKPFSKVEPMPTVATNNKKPKKSVRFSLEPPKVHVFEIEEGNNMKKTSLVKTSLLDARQAPIFSLEKITLMRILRWNPQWLEEQINNNEPPPILGTNKAPPVLHSFSSHSQYIQVVGDLLLMEIWECLSQGYMRVRNQAKGVEMRIASLPPISTQDRCFELFNISVNVSVPNSEIRTVPRMGEIILVTFGAENARNRRFFYVHNVRTLSSPPNNRNSFFCISLHACYTDKMKNLKPGELMIGVTLSFIQKELMLFEAMEHLAMSPLSEAILKPEARHFVKWDPNASHLPTQLMLPLSEAILKPEARHFVKWDPNASHLPTQYSEAILKPEARHFVKWDPNASHLPTQKEVMLPLSEAILKPEARHFVKWDPNASHLPTQKEVMLPLSEAILKPEARHFVKWDPNASHLPTQVRLAYRRSLCCLLVKPS
ncbi:FHA domain-containing protein [Phthorimaea operculella]|nr:FHA domain-containing protein [Phthorimaea operculella]